MLATGIRAFAGLVMRYRRADDDVRQQIRWLALVGVMFLGFVLLGIALGIAAPSVDDGAFGTVLFALMFTTLVIGIPVACGVAILRYRLYDLDVVIRKAVVFAAPRGVHRARVRGDRRRHRRARRLAARTRRSRSSPPRCWRSRSSRRATRRAGSRTGSSTAGARRRTRSSPSSPSASGEHVRDRRRAAADGADRSAQGDGRATPRRSGCASAASSVPRRRGRTSGTAAPIPAVGDALPDLGEPAVEVRHRGELLGALSVAMPPNDPMDPTKERLVARPRRRRPGLVLRNVRLIEELRASRQRLVAAQDEERRKLERNLHDGAQQQLVALQVQLAPRRAAHRARPGEERQMLARSSRATAARRARRPPRPRARHLPAAARRPGPRRGARGPGAQGVAAGRGRRRRRSAATRARSSRPSTSARSRR